MHVVAHVAVSLDGATTGFRPDVGRFYELAATWREDVTLVGADTILGQEEALASAPRPGPREDGPLLTEVVRVDSGGALIGALLDAGLLDEISLLVHPCLAAGPDVRRWDGERAPEAADLELLGAERLDGGLVWVRYRLPG